MWNKFIHDLLLIWVTIEPLSSLSLFTAITSTMSFVERRKVALRAVGYSVMVLLVAIIIGQILLAIMGIKLISFQLAGGVILFLFGLQMIFGQSSSLAAGAPEAGHDIAVFPLAIPSIVGPESIVAIILLTDNHLYSIPTQALTTLAMIIVLAITYVLMLFSELILRVIGNSGAAILERLMGMFLTALAVELVMAALGVDRWIGSAK
jgi:multiple antibiotic resistance protein